MGGKQGNDYQMFGTLMPGRSLNLSESRHLFNGMEADGEVSGEGNSYTTQFRQYDPRLGRWKSLDPLAGKYPGQSPYASFNNNPVFFTDPQAAARLRTRGLGNRPTGCRKMLKTEVFMRQKKEWRFTLG